MKLKKNLVFLGMMGSGKSSIGLLVSKKLKLNFIDVDNVIEHEFGAKISKIFESKGEEYFRELEEKISVRMIKKNKSVIALGGGAFLNKNIRKEILDNHLSFWLNWNTKTLIDRIKNSPKRPIAFKASNYELNEIIKKRSNFYAKALYKIDCENLSKNEILNIVLKICETN
tara:strand:- start:619 stop:1131 length:513 start_codon:yes stop_codon:yes gene_type:complete